MYRRLLADAVRATRQKGHPLSHNSNRMPLSHACCRSLGRVWRNVSHMTFNTIYIVSHIRCRLYKGECIADEELLNLKQKADRTLCLATVLLTSDGSAGYLCKRARSRLLTVQPTVWDQQSEDSTIAMLSTARHNGMRNSCITLVLLQVLTTGERQAVCVLLDSETPPPYPLTPTPATLPHPSIRHFQNIASAAALPKLRTVAKKCIFQVTNLLSGFRQLPRLKGWMSLRQPRWLADGRRGF